MSRSREEIARIDEADGLADDRRLYSDIRDDETVDEYLTRMAPVWHPEELKN